MFVFLRTSSKVRMYPAVVWFDTWMWMHAWTWKERIWAGEIVRMLLTEKLAWENTEQELVVCDAINLIYEVSALIWCTDWQHCEDSPTFLCECERQLTCFDFNSRSFPRIDVKKEEGTYIAVKFFCAQTSKKMTFSTLFGNVSPLFSESVTWELHDELQSPLKELVCCCVNSGNDLFTLCVCVCRCVCWPTLSFKAHSY